MSGRRLKDIGFLWGLMKINVPKLIVEAGAWLQI